MSGGVTMESVLGALTSAHMGTAAGAKTSLLDELAGPGAPGQAKDAKFERQLGTELEADAVKAGAHTLGTLPTVGGKLDAKAPKDEKSDRPSTSASSDDDKAADETDDVAPDAQLLAMAQAMTAAPMALPVAHATKMQAAMHDAMAAVARGEQPTPALPNVTPSTTSDADPKAAPALPTAAPAVQTAPTGKISLEGMTAVTPAEAKTMLQDARIDVSPLPPSASHPLTTPVAAHLAAQTQPAFTFTPPAARAAATHVTVTAPPVTVPAHASVTVSAPPPSPPQAEDRGQSAPNDQKNASDPHAARQSLFAGAKPRASTSASATDSASSTTAASGSDVTTTAADFMTAPTVSAASAPAAMTNFVNVPTTVKGMTSSSVGGTSSVRSTDATETAVRNAEAVGHKRVLASGDAQGALMVEDLGRFEVRAHAHDDGRVDVQVRAEHRDGAAALDAHAAELRADVRVELPRANVHVQGAPTGDASQSSAGNLARERQREAQARGEQSENRGVATRPSGVANTAPTTEQASTNRRNERVRIVL